MEKYVIEKCVDGEFSPVCEAEGTEFSVVDLVPNTEYLFAVSALNEVGRGKRLQMDKAVLTPSPVSECAVPLGFFFFFLVSNKNLILLIFFHLIYGLVKE